MRDHRRLKLYPPIHSSRERRTSPQFRHFRRSKYTMNHKAHRIYRIYTEESLERAVDHRGQHQPHASWCGICGEATENEVLNVSGFSSQQITMPEQTSLRLTEGTACELSTAKYKVSLPANDFQASSVSCHSFCGVRKREALQDERTTTGRHLLLSGILQMLPATARRDKQ